MEKMLLILDRVHAAVTRNKWAQLFTAFVRVLLAIGFIPPSIPKILHQPFTSLPETNPVGDFFGALYRTGFYYEFIGWGQIIAAVLLMFPRTAHLGAFLFLPIIANIVVLTFSVGFEGTTYITALMLLAVIYLVAWEYDRWKSFVFDDRSVRVVSPNAYFITMPLFFATGGAAVAALLIAFGIGGANRRSASVVLMLSITGLLFGGLCALHHRLMKVGALKAGAQHLD